MELFLTKDEFWQQREKAFSEDHEVTYVISCYQNEENKTKRSVPRVLSNDKDGTLYIGKAENVMRLVTLLLSIRPQNKGKGHPFGIRYKQNPKYKELYPYDLLAINLIPTKDSRITEKEIISKYIENYGELPPLNHSE